MLQINRVHRSRRTSPVTMRASGSKTSAKQDDVIFQALLKEPVTFLGGIAAGFLALSLDDGERMLGVLCGRSLSLILHVEF